MRPKPFFKQGLHDASPAILLLMEKAGGPTALGIRCGTSGQTISDAIERKRVSDSALAHLMADVAVELGEPWITSRVLAGLDACEVRPTGSEPDDEAATTDDGEGALPNVASPPRRANLAALAGRADARPQVARLRQRKPGSPKNPAWTSRSTERRTGTDG